MLELAQNLLLTLKFELMFLIFFMFLIVMNWNMLFHIFNLRSYTSKQRLHRDEVPRVGGIITFLFLSLIAFFKFESDLLNLMLISFIPLAIISLKEDLLHNTTPRSRMLIMIFSCLIFLSFIPSQFPEIDIPFLNELLNLKLIGFIFFIFSMLIIINGNNLIDGVNGNMGMTNFIQLLALAILGFKVGDYEFLNLCILLMIPLIVFLFFNFPFGKIFMGDFGAYFYGFMLSGFVIYFFGIHKNLLSWNAVIILLYPSIELLFSFLRKKIFEGKSPLSADAKHLHSLIFRYFNLKRRKLNNSFVTLFMLPFISMPLFSIIYFDHLIAILFTIFAGALIYIFMYLYYLNKLEIRND